MQTDNLNQETWHVYIAHAACGLGVAEHDYAMPVLHDFLGASSHMYDGPVRIQLYVGTL